MNQLIIGGLSKIGINFMNYYISKEQSHFFCLCDKKENEKYISINKELNKNYTIIVKDVTLENIEDILSKNDISKVVNFYELEDGNYSKEQYTKSNYDFVVGMYKLCEKYNVKHLTHLSSVKVYGSSFTTYFNERSETKATCDYTHSKIESDNFLLSQTTVKTAIVRIGEVFSHVYGNNFLDNILNSLSKDLDLIVDEESDFIRSYINIYDCEHIIYSISNKSLTGIYNVTSDFFISAKEIITIIQKEFNLEDNNIIYTQKKKVTIPCLKTDNTYTCNTINYSIDMQEEKFKHFLRDIAYRNRLKL